MLNRGTLRNRCAMLIVSICLEKSISMKMVNTVGNVFSFQAMLGSKLMFRFYLKELSNVDYSNKRAGLIGLLAKF